MRLNVELPVIYANRGVPPRHRRPSTYAVADKAFFSIPVAPETDLEPVLRLRVVYEDAAGTASTEETLFHKIGGRLVRPVEVQDPASRFRKENGVSAELLAGMARWRPGSLPRQLWVPDAGYHYEYGTPYAAASIKDKHVETSGRERAIRKLQDCIDERLVIVGGSMFGTVRDPKINVWIGRDDFHVSRQLCASGPYAFPVDCGEEADEFCRWLEEEQAIPFNRRGDHWVRDSAFEILSRPLPLADNPVVMAAEWLADRAQLNIVNVDYFGPEVRRLGQAFRDDPTICTAMDFVSAFEEAALLPDASQVTSYRTNAQVFSTFRKFVELMPDQYKAGYTDTVSIPLDLGALSPVSIR